jgi:hypothetical protein
MTDAERDASILRRNPSNPEGLPKVATSQRQPTRGVGGRKLLQGSQRDSSQWMYLIVYVVQSAYYSGIEGAIATGVANTNGALARAGAPGRLVLLKVEVVSDSLHCMLACQSVNLYARLLS